MYVHVHACVHMGEIMCMCVCVYACMFVHMCACVHVCGHAHRSVCVCVCMHTWRPEINLRCVSSGAVHLDFGDLVLTTKAKSILPPPSWHWDYRQAPLSSFPLGPRD